MSTHQENHDPGNHPGPLSPRKRLEDLLSQPSNRFCADCGSPDPKWQVYDKDTFSTDDRMGGAEIDIQPLVSAAKAYEDSTISESMHLGKCLASDDNTLVKDSIISLDNGKVKQEITLKLQNVERGELEIELECVPLSQ